MKYPMLAVLMAFSMSAYAAPAEWTGCYAGLNAGYGTGNNQWTTTFFNGTAYNDDAGSARSRGAVGGAQIGCDMQRANWVWGVQGMLDGADMKGDHHYASGTAQDTVTYETKALGTLAARAGFLVSPKTLVYAKAGWAWARNTYEDNVPDGTPPMRFGKTQTRDGWLAGLGVEYRLTPSVSLLAEYNRIDLGKQSVHLDQKVGTGINDYQATIDQDRSSWLLGVNYRF